MPGIYTTGNSFLKEHIVEEDYLTGLSSRRGLYDFYNSLTRDTVVHAMYLDVDNFKRVNDVYGHSMGDKLLIAISDLIREHIRTSGFASRIGGDEYVVLLSGELDQPTVENIASMLLTGMHNLSFRKDILSLISLSIGIVFGQRVTQKLDDVLAKCDVAMYNAKNNGKNRYTIFRADDKFLEINRMMELEMAAALENNEFEVYLQPKVNMITSTLTGAEAFSRWNHPKDGLRLPDLYIPLFEKDGFITKLDLYIFEEACKAKASWTGKKYEHIPISVNMSRLHLYNKHLPEDLEKITNKYNISPGELELEITEATFLKDSPELLAMISRLKKHGFRVSIDNFGSGFSALSLLQDIHVNSIKIDRSFLKTSSGNPLGRKVLRHSIAMCRDLKMDVVATGVETKEQVELVTRCGCTTGQGFYYAAPLPIDSFMQFADEYLNNTLSAYTFHFNGDLKTEDGSKEGVLCVDPGSEITFTDGIFKGSKALSFPGGPTEHNIVHIPTECIVNDSFAVSMWIRPRATHFWTSALYIKFETGFCSIVPNAWESHSSFRIRDSKEVNGWYDVSGIQLNENVWWHYVISYNAMTETAIAYINGEVVSTLENVPTNRYVKRIVIGGDVFQPSLVGDVCELVIYNEAKDYNFVYNLHQSYVTDKDFIGFPLPQDDEI